MNVGTLLLAIWLFLTGSEELGWFSVNSTLMGILAFLAAIFILVGSVGVLTIPFPSVRYRAE